MQSPAHELEFLKTPAEHQRPLLNPSQQSVLPPTDSEHRASPSKNSQSRWFILSWKYQLLSWLGSLACFIATVVVLRVFDGKPLPNLRIGITPNAIVGLLSTFTELLLVVPVNSAFGQLKWLRSLRARPMDDFRAIDDASRGPWGSVLLLAHRTGGLTASFGAMITILALGINTFTQQALRYDNIYPYSEGATVPVAQSLNMDRAFSGGGSLSSGIDPELVSAAYTGIFSKDNADFAPNAICDTTNCTWESYQTLAVCNTCADLTTKLERSKERVSHNMDGTRHTPWNTNYYKLPGINFLLSGTQSKNEKMPRESAIMNVTTSRMLDSAWNAASVAFPNNGSRLLGIFAIGPSPGTIPEEPDATHGDGNMTGSPFAPPVAYECNLQFCVHTKRAQYLNGVFNETTVSTWIDQSKKQPLTSEKSDIVLYPPNSSANFTITWLTLVNMQQWITSLFLGNATAYQNQILNRELDDTTASSIISQTVFYAMNRTSQGFPNMMDNLAASISLNMRTMSDQPAPIRGKAFSSESHAVVTWVWLILPALELFGSLVFLVAVIFESRKANLAPWLNNALAYFFHGLDGRPPRAELSQSQETMEHEAKSLLMEYQPHHDGGRLVLVDKSVG